MNSSPNTKGSSKRPADSSLDVSPPKRKLPRVISQSTSYTFSCDTSLDPEVAPALNFYTPSRMIEILFYDYEPTGFFIHCNVLAHFSLFFRMELNDVPNLKTIALDCSEYTGGLLQNWFYTQIIKGPTGAVTLVEYAKLWKLAKHLVIAVLTTVLMDLIDSTPPGDDDEDGNTLRDFQIAAYTGTYRGLEDLAIAKTLSAVDALNFERLLEDMPDDMRGSFTLAMTRGCVSLPGWSTSEEGGFEGVNNRSRFGSGHLHRVVEE